MVWIVLPRPMSSARTPFAPTRSRSKSQFTPTIWCGRSFKSGPQHRLTSAWSSGLKSVELLEETISPAHNAPCRVDDARPATQLRDQLRRVRAALAQ